MPPVTKRARENTSTDLKERRQSEAMSSQLMGMINARFDEQASLLTTNVREAEERILKVLLVRLDDMAGEVKLLGERVRQLESEVNELKSVKHRVSILEAKVSAQVNANYACDLRMHGLPHVEGEDLRTLYNTLCVALNLTPPPRIREIFRARRNGQSVIDPVNTTPPWQLWILLFYLANRGKDGQIAQHQQDVSKSEF
ncbi:hypothetical protein ACLKA7_006641 [Drosophila subpalustris]